MLFWNYRRGIEEYQIQWRESGGNWRTKYVSGARSAKQQRDVDEGRQPRATTTVISGLESGIDYDFRIRAEGDGVTYDDDYGPWATDEATTCSTPTPTPTPTPDRTGCGVDTNPYAHTHADRSGCGVDTNPYSYADTNPGPVGASRA